jgi:hypothetical protein
MEAATMQTEPLVTVAVLSWNRMHYLRATLASARQCIRYPLIEWIVSDNESEEPGLREYIEGSEWVNVRIIRRQSHAEAMNEIVARASGDYLLLWPEDMQFVVEGPWMHDCVEVLRDNPDIGSLILDGLRQTTVRRLIHAPRRLALYRLAEELYWYRGRVRWPREVVSSSHKLPFLTLGWMQPGVCPSGIPSLARTAVWRQLGPWRSSAGPARDLVDSSKGAEDGMLSRFHRSRWRLQQALPFLPVAADIITDPLGCKAKVRNGVRYGVYMPPQDGQPYYYGIRSMDEFRPCDRTEPYSFRDIAVPLGFRIPVDRNGDRLKFPLNDSIQYDVLKGQSIEFPLKVREQTM